MNTVTGIIQARLGSTRLPGKMLMDLNGYPVIDWVFLRVTKSKNLDTVIFAIPDTEKDNSLAQHLTGLGATVYRGSEHDVLSRFYNAAVFSNADMIVRICADNPFVSPSEIDRLIDFFCGNLASYDYAYNHIPKNNTYPDGLGAEITTLKILEKLYKEAVSHNHREHIFDYLWENKNLFSIGTFNPESKNLAHPDIKLDLDTEEDYSRLLKLNVTPDMSAVDIVNAAIKVWH